MAGTTAEGRRWVAGRSGKGTSGDEGGEPRMADWSAREDRTQAPGCFIRMATTSRGLCVRYLLVLRRVPIWRPGIGPLAVTVRCYDGGEITLAEEPWED